MTNVLHLNDRYGLDRHQDSIMASLSHRLNVARASNNAHLVALLEREKQQVAPKSNANAVQARGNWWTSVTQFVMNQFFGGSELQVCEIVDGRDRWWVASNPQNGQVIYADSEAELRLWIEENYQGR